MKEVFENLNMTERHYQTCGIVQTNDNFLRLMTLLNHTELELYYKIFHDPQFGAFPTEPEKLYKELEKYEARIKTMLEEKQINQVEYKLAFPDSHATYSQAFTTNLFYALSKECVEKIPQIDVALDDDDDGLKNRVVVFNELDKLQVLTKDKKLKDNVNSSSEVCDQKWNEITEVLKRLHYDVTNVSDLKSGDLDASKKFRFALIRSEMALLRNECSELKKTSEVNNFAVTKLLRNFNDAVSQSHEDTTSTQSINTDDELKHLKERIQTTSVMLADVLGSIKTVEPQMKLWKERNIEGDIIVIDDRLTKLKNEVDEQSFTVGELFSSVSLDIVKIKERMSFNGDNVKYLGTPEHGKERRSHSLRP